MQRFLSSLRSRFLLLVLLALVPALGLVIYSASEQRRVAEAQVQENALRLVRLTANEYDDAVGNTQQFLAMLAQFPAVQDRDKTLCHELLSRLQKQYPQYLQLGVAELDGTVSCTAIPDSRPVNISSRVYFRRSLVTKQFAVGEYLVGLISGRSTIGFGYPLLDNAGQAQGVVFASLDLGLFNKLAALALMPPGSVVTLMDQNATILARYPDPGPWVGLSVPEAPIARLILERKTESIAESVGVDGVSRLYAFTPLSDVPDSNIYASVGLSNTVAFAEVNRALIFNLVALGLVAVFALIAAWIGSQVFIQRPIRALSGVTSRLADGDLSARTGLNYGVDELSQLVRSFDKMVEALEQRDKERKQAEEQSRRWSTQLENLINGVAEANSKPLDVGSIASIVLDRTVSAMGLAGGCIFLNGRKDLSLVAHVGISEAGVQRMQKLEVGEKTTGEIAKLSHSDTAQNISSETHANWLETAEGAFTWTSVPIKAKDRTLGIMCLAIPDSRPIEPYELKVLTGVGQQIGVAIENAELYEQVQSIATLKERERISRELHDGVAQVLGYLCIRNKATADLVAADEIERAGAQLQEMQGTLQEAYQDVRESILGLRETVSPERNLSSALKEYARKFSQQSNIRVYVNLDSAVQRACTPGAEIQLLRIIQESLSNVRKHSEAKQAWIKFKQGGSSAIVTIEDDGKGFDPDSISRNGQLHFGLQTMRERAESVGGNLQVWSQPGQGTKVVVTLPYKQGEE